MFGTRFANTKNQNNVRALKITQEVLIMETSLISTFAGLSIVLGLLVGLGTLSVIRGQLIVMGSVYLLLRTVYPQTLLKVKLELQAGPTKCH
jgi:hypothetical protein